MALVEQGPCELLPGGQRGFPRVERADFSAHPLSVYCREKSAAVAEHALFGRTAAVAALLTSVSPTAVVRGVPFGVVYSVQAVRRTWTDPHVGKKVLERLPSVADSYAPLKVKAPVRSVGLTAIEHASPHAVFLAARTAMRKIPCDSSVAVEAPAAFCRAAQKRPPGNRLYDAARASAHPLTTVVSVRAKRHQSTKQSSFDVVFLSHDELRGALA